MNSADTVVQSAAFHTLYPSSSPLRHPFSNSPFLLICSYYPTPPSTSSFYLCLLLHFSSSSSTLSSTSTSSFSSLSSPPPPPSCLLCPPLPPPQPFFKPLNPPRPSPQQHLLLLYPVFCLPLPSSYSLSFTLCPSSLYPQGALPHSAAQLKPLLEDADSKYSCRSRL